MLLRTLSDHASANAEAQLSCDPRWGRENCVMLRRALRAEIDLDEIAKVACLSKYHFLRLFALVHGMTPFSYLQRKRARVALRLLRTAAFTVAEVACSVGFGQRTTVLRQIRRWTGLRPLQIRTAGVSR